MWRFMLCVMIGFTLLISSCGQQDALAPETDQAPPTPVDSPADPQAEPAHEEPPAGEAPDEVTADPHPTTPRAEPSAVPQEIAQTMADIDALVATGQFTEARRLAQEQAAVATGNGRDTLDQRVQTLRRLERQAVQARSALELLEGSSIEQRRGRRMLLDSGPAGRILLTQAVRSGPPALADQAATLLVILDEAPAFPALLERLLASEQSAEEQDLGEKLRDAMVAMTPDIDAEALRDLANMIPQQTGAIRRHLIDIVLAIGDDDTVDQRLGAGTSERMHGHIKQAFESGDAPLVAWSLGHAARAGLGIPGFRAEWFHNHELEGPHEWRSIETVLNWPNLSYIPLVDETGRREWISGRFTGDFLAPQSGTYTFFTNSDDGSRLWINDEMVVDNWGMHGMQVRSGTIDLTANTLYRVRVDWMQGGGGAGLIVTYKGPGDEDQRLLDSNVVRTLPWDK